jgi:hypothetical protein
MKHILIIIFSLILLNQEVNAQSDYVGLPLNVVKLQMSSDFAYMKLNQCENNTCEYWRDVNRNDIPVTTMMIGYKNNIVTSIALTVRNTELAKYMYLLKELPIDCESSQGGEYTWVGANKVFSIYLGKETFTYMIILI